MLDKKNLSTKKPLKQWDMEVRFLLFHYIVCLFFPCFPRVLSSRKAFWRKSNLDRQISELFLLVELREHETDLNYLREFSKIGTTKNQMVYFSFMALEKNECNSSSALSISLIRDWVMVQNLSFRFKHFEAKIS